MTLGEGTECQGGNEGISVNKDLRVVENKGIRSEQTELRSLRVFFKRRELAS